jgi:hypothetical protein
MSLCKAPLILGRDNCFKPVILPEFAYYTEDNWLWPTSLFFYFDAGSGQDVPYGAYSEWTSNSAVCHGIINFPGVIRVMDPGTSSPLTFQDGFHQAIGEAMMAVFPDLGIPVMWQQYFGDALLAPLPLYGVDPSGAITSLDAATILGDHLNETILGSVFTVVLSPQPFYEDNLIINPWYQGMSDEEYFRFWYQRAVGMKSIYLTFESRTALDPTFAVQNESARRQIEEGSDGGGRPWSEFGWEIQEYSGVADLVEQAREFFGV